MSAENTWLLSDLADQHGSVCSRLEINSLGLKYSGTAHETCARCHFCHDLDANITGQNENLWAHLTQLRPIVWKGQSCFRFIWVHGYEKCFLFLCVQCSSCLLWQVVTMALGLVCLNSTLCLCKSILSLSQYLYLSAAASKETKNIQMQFPYLWVVLVGRSNPSIPTHLLKTTAAWASSACRLL